MTKKLITWRTRAASVLFGLLIAFTATATRTAH